MEEKEDNMSESDRYVTSPFVFGWRWCSEKGCQGKSIGSIVHPWSLKGCCLSVVIDKGTESTFGK